MRLADRVRRAASRLREFPLAALSDAAEVRSYLERKAVRESFFDFLARGEVERIGYGRYRYIGRKNRMTYRQRFWDIARRMIRFSLSDLEQITEARRETIKEFCYWMVRKGYAQRVKRGHFKIVGRLGPIVPKYSKRSDSDESRKVQR